MQMQQLSQQALALMADVIYMQLVPQTLADKQWQPLSFASPAVYMHGKAPPG